MEQLSDIEKLRKRSPSSVCRSSTSHQLSRARKRHSGQSLKTVLVSQEAANQPDRRSWCLSDSEISSPEKQSVTRSLHTQRPCLKPPKFDGSTAFESCLVQFQNSAAFNKWNKAEQLAFLRGALDAIRHLSTAFRPFTVSAQRRNKTALQPSQVRPRYSAVPSTTLSRMHTPR